MLGCVDQFLKVLLCFERSSVRACLFEKKRMSGLGKKRKTVTTQIGIDTEEETEEEEEETMLMSGMITTSVQSADPVRMSKAIKFDSEQKVAFVNEFLTEQERAPGVVDAGEPNRNAARDFAESKNIPFRTFSAWINKYRPTAITGVDGVDRYPPALSSRTVPDERDSKVADFIRKMDAGEVNSAKEYAEENNILYSTFRHWLASYRSKHGCRNVGDPLEGLEGEGGDGDAPPLPKLFFVANGHSKEFRENAVLDFIRLNEDPSTKINTKDYASKHNIAGSTFRVWLSQFRKSPPEHVSYDNISDEVRTAWLEPSKGRSSADREAIVLEFIREKNGPNPRSSKEYAKSLGVEGSTLRAWHAEYRKRESHVEETPSNVELTARAEAMHMPKEFKEGVVREYYQVLRTGDSITPRIFAESKGLKEKTFLYWTLMFNKEHKDESIHKERKLPQFPDVEQQLVDYVRTELAKLDGSILSNVDAGVQREEAKNLRKANLIEKSQAFANNAGHVNFKGSYPWINGVLKRNDLEEEVQRRLHIGRQTYNNF